ncbi:exo-rhamnogalacturonan lyase family protein [Gracilibacillus alcaliphilus]|uniref:exo-rhamnogalacturonan lyase family protein n=1 Tax=Gracilibacillus alcaliphilus TaxID=1401441 RepID=UPI003083FB12|nr:hypothetical protein [Gracilibacillus alcaliphilus]
MIIQTNIPLSWLETDNHLSTGVTWGIPWEKGQLKRLESYMLKVGNADTSDTSSLPVQTWPTAFWPDGSVKWTAHAASIPGGLLKQPVSLTDAAALQQSEVLTVEETDERIIIDTNTLICKVNKKGSFLIEEMSINNTTSCQKGRLIGIRESHHRTEGIDTYRQETFYSEIYDVTVEQAGPIRAVIKVTGRHRLSSNKREWLPFQVRLYFYAQQPEVKIVHSFLYDGNPHQDFIKGIGLEFAVPMQGALYNRYVRLAGEEGFFSESPKGLLTLRTQGKYEEMYKKQRSGRPIQFEEGDQPFIDLLDDAATWNHYKLVQHSVDSYSIAKQTQAGCAWVHAVNGSRSGGLVYVGSEIGGITVGLRNFWKKYPASFEISDLAAEQAVVRTWFWSPEVQAMDMRHYDTETHVSSSYEGAEELRSTPYGVGNTSELYINCFAVTPDIPTLKKLVGKKESPPLLVGDPAYYHQTKALGIWSLRNTDTPIKARLEQTLDEVLGFYLKEIEQRKWYGFWDYGDVMHSYDPVRHVWRYDLGGCAWQNTELAPNYWLWYMFLRTGRTDIFRMAEAMTRHTSEVDVYHKGAYKGLGSRHNVSHWGCGCKEARIGAAGLHRFYYYLTADERIGDMMDEVVDADYTTVYIDPMRAYFPEDQYSTHTRSGPDWAAFCSNWLTKWERYQDHTYRDKLFTGIKCLEKMPFRLLTGPVFGYEPRTGELFYMGAENKGHHLIFSMGGAQVWMEMAELLEDSRWQEMLVEFGAFYNLSPEEKSRLTNGEIKGVDWNIPMLSASLVAYAAAKKQDGNLAALAWKLLLEEQSHWHIKSPLLVEEVTDYLHPIQEIKGISTNTAAQWSLNVMICLELIDDALDDSYEEMLTAGKEETGG